MPLRRPKRGGVCTLPRYCWVPPARGQLSSTPRRLVKFFNTVPTIYPSAKCASCLDTGVAESNGSILCCLPYIFPRVFLGDNSFLFRSIHFNSFLFIIFFYVFSHFILSNLVNEAIRRAPTRSLAKLIQALNDVSITALYLSSLTLPLALDHIFSPPFPFYLNDL